MNKDDTNSDNNFDDDDFDFLEEEPLDEVKTTQTQRSELGTKQWLILLGILVTLGYIIYSLFFDKADPVKQQPIQSAPAVKQEQVVAPKKEQKSSDSENSQLDEQFDDIAEAFSTIDTDNSNSNSKDFNSIDEIKKELFVDNSVADETTEPESLQSGLYKLNHRLDNNVSHLHRLESTLESLANTLRKVSGNFASFENKILKISQQLAKINKEVMKLKKDFGDEIIVENNSDKNKPLVYKGPEYVVHAVIPGRAWLKSSKGQIITISEGDTIDDYGKILVIDAENGVVLTSSGISFR